MFNRRIVSYVKLIQVRQFGYFITTPIFYANSSPHVGHVYTLLLADAINIHQRLKLNTSDTIFSTGVDEHGIKVQTAAEASNIQCQKFCDINANKFIESFKQYNTTFTDFVRTSDERHKLTARSVWEELNSRGFIYKDLYSGWYCKTDETFVPESQVTKKETLNGELVYQDANGNEVHWSSEENYMFRMSRVYESVMKWLVDEKPVVPNVFNEEAIGMMKNQGAHDISISRPIGRIHWGIKVPDDEMQVIYVWLDALSNYLTVAGYQKSQTELRRWPIDCQVIGKDIIKFHAIYWPSFLKALCLPLPKKIICHSHWLIDSKKMSKSLGNVVEPTKESEVLSPEGLRYYLLRGGVPSHDTDYNRALAINRTNSEIADTYGNLLSRCCSKAVNPEQCIPIRLLGKLDPAADEVIDQLSYLHKICDEHYNDANFYKGVDEIMRALRLVNTLFFNTKPWQLVKEIGHSDKSFKEHNNILAISFEALRICSVLLQPIVPQITRTALDRLSISDRNWENSKLILQDGDREPHVRKFGGDSQPILFKKIKNA